MSLRTFYFVLNYRDDIYSSMGLKPEHRQENELVFDFFIRNNVQDMEWVKLQVYGQCPEKFPSKVVDLTEILRRVSLKINFLV